MNEIQELCTGMYIIYVYFNMISLIYYAMLLVSQDT